MATIFSHAIVAAALKKSWLKFDKGLSRKVMALCIFGSILPDFDVIGFAMGIRYEEPLGHRGFTHSFLFAALYGVICGFLIFKKETKKIKLSLSILFFLCVISHSVLDALTNGGLGVGFFIPFDNGRYFFPWTPIEVSPIGRNFFSVRGLMVLLNEFKIILLPIFVLFGIKFFFKRKVSN